MGGYGAGWWMITFPGSSGCVSTFVFAAKSSLMGMLIDWATRCIVKQMLHGEQTAPGTLMAMAISITFSRRHGLTNRYIMPLYFLSHYRQNERKKFVLICCRSYVTQLPHTSNYPLTLSLMDYIHHSPSDYILQQIGVICMMLFSDIKTSGGGTAIAEGRAIHIWDPTLYPTIILLTECVCFSISKILCMDNHKIVCLPK